MRTIVAHGTTIRDVARVALMSVGTVSATAGSGAARRPPQVTALAPRLLVRDSCRRSGASAGGAA
jgi:DNA-binding LacI/PurR family transcriptional regulator